MFEAKLKSSIENIFGLDKVSFDVPSEHQEQECVFIQIVRAKPTIKDGRQLCLVEGTVRVFANSEKMPYGYFMKRLRDAPETDTKGLVFFDFEENAGTFRNITERSLGFRYFFDSQYDPEIGTITSIETEVIES